jgi:hypothetical protein
MELERLFPAFRRQDALEWRKWKLYPGAMVLLIPRIILLIAFSLVCFILLKIFLICHDHRRPYFGIRKFLINGAYYICCRFIGVFVFSTWHTYRYLSEREVDYSEYLGSNELQSVASSIGGLMKEFYSRNYEHSSFLIR